jgi:hypothetical protein
MPNFQWLLINWELIGQLVDIDVWPQKSQPMDQFAELANGAQHIVCLLGISGYKTLSYIPICSVVCERLKWRISNIRSPPSNKWYKN